MTSATTMTMTKTHTKTNTKTKTKTFKKKALLPVHVSLITLSSMNIYRQTVSWHYI